VTHVRGWLNRQKPFLARSLHVHGCSQGTPILGQSSGVSTIRLPEHHEVEVSEIRFFVAGPSLQPESINGIDSDKDSWMLRSLCILVDTSQGDLHLYSGAKTRIVLSLQEYLCPMFHGQVKRPVVILSSFVVKVLYPKQIKQQTTSGITAYIVFVIFLLKTGCLRQLLDLFGL